MDRTDVVFPQGNEEKLVEIAGRLGFARLILCYPLDDPHLKGRKEEVGKLSGRVETVFAVLAEDQKGIQRAQQLTEHVVAIGKPGTFEDKRARYVIGFETGPRKDFIHHRNAGLTQVSIAHCIRTGKTILVNAGQLLTDDAHVVLGRMMQNNTLFRKYRPGVLVVSGAREALDMRAPRDLESLLRL